MTTVHVRLSAVAYPGQGDTGAASPYPLCSVEQSQELKFQAIFSGSCQGYFEWPVKDLGAIGNAWKKRIRGILSGM